MIRIFCVIALVITFSAALYGNSFHNPFIWDDIELIVDNPFIRQVSNLPQIFASNLFGFSNEGANYYRPIQALSNMLDYKAWGLNPLGYHITNTLLHSIVALLIYFLIYLISARKRLSLFATLLYLVNPVHAEAVTYISGRADSLAAIFFLSALIFYIKGKDAHRKSAYCIFSLICFTIALLSKEIAVIFPFAIILYDTFFNAGEMRKPKKLTIYSMFFLILAIYAVLRATVLNFSHYALFNLHSDLSLKLVTSIKSIFIYIGILLFPFSLRMDRHLPLPVSIFGIGSIASIIALIILLTVAVRLRNSRFKILSFGFFWYLLTLLPVLGIFMPGKNFTIAEHWLYLPSMGIFIIIGFMLDKLYARSKKVSLAVLLILLTFYSFLTIKQNTIWSNPVVFYKRLILFSSDNPKLHVNLGAIYEQMLEQDEAITEYKKAADLDPSGFSAHNNLGNLYVSQGKLDLALIEYSLSLKNKPHYFLTYNNLGNLYASMQDYSMAIKEYQKSIKFNPYYSQAHNNLGLVYLEKGDYLEAENEFKQALKLNPNNAEIYNNLGNLYVKKGLTDEAIKCYNRSISLKADFDKPYFNLGVVYFQIGLMDKARQEWYKVLKINPNHAGAARNLELLRGK